MDNTDFLDLKEIRNSTFGLNTTDFTEKADKIYNNNHNKNNNNNNYYYYYFIIILIIIIIIIDIIVFISF